MNKRKTYKSKNVNESSWWRFFLTLVVPITISLILIITSTKTINLIYQTKREQDSKEITQVQAYLELIKFKNEEIVVSSDEFLRRQGREIFHMGSSNEERIIITNKQDLDEWYKELKTNAQSNKNNEASSTGWTLWLQIIRNGL